MSISSSGLGPLGNLFFSYRCTVTVTIMLYPNLFALFLFYIANFSSGTSQSSTICCIYLTVQMCMWMRHNYLGIGVMFRWCQTESPDTSDCDCLDSRGMVCYVLNALTVIYSSSSSSASSISGLQEHAPGWCIQLRVSTLHNAQPAERSGTSLRSMSSCCKSLRRMIASLQVCRGLLGCLSQSEGRCWLTVVHVCTNQVNVCVIIHCSRVDVW